MKDIQIPKNLVLSKCEELKIGYESLQCILDSADGYVRKIDINGLTEYADDDAADADVNLLSGALYKIAGSRGMFQKP